MPKYLFAYRAPNSYAPGDPEAMEQWTRYFEELGNAVDQIGNPVFTASTVGTCDESTRLGGFSFVNADDLESAVALAKGAPAIASGGGVEVGEITELM
jgi:YCII-related domain